MICLRRFEDVNLSLIIGPRLRRVRADHGGLVETVGSRTDNSSAKRWKIYNDVKRSLDQFVRESGKLILLKFLCCLILFQSSFCHLWQFWLNGPLAFAFANAETLVLQMWRDLLTMQMELWTQLSFTWQRFVNLTHMGKIILMLDIKAMISRKNYSSYLSISGCCN